MGIQGLYATDDMISEERPFNWRAGILMRMPGGSAPLTALTAVMRSERTTDPRFNWFEKVMANQRMELSADPLTGTSFAVIDDGKGGAMQLTIDTLLYSEETGEIMRVSANPSTATALTVERGWGAASGGVAATAIPISSSVSPYLSVIGTAFREGADVPEERAYSPSVRYGLTQIFRNSIGITKTARATETRTPEKVADMKKEALMIHSNGMERAYFFGIKHEDLTGPKPKRTCDGICTLLTNYNSGSNVIDMQGVSAGAGFDMDDLESTMELIFRYGSDEKVAFSGNTALLNLQKVVRKNTNYQIYANEKEYGMRVMRVITPFGELVLKRHRLFNEMRRASGTTYQAMANDMVVLDMENVRYRYLRDRDTKYLPNRQGNGIDGDQSEWLTESAVEFNILDTHFWLRDMTGAKVDA